MTKTWEEVREEICRLYGEGHSLEHIRKTLCRQRHFEASTRAFRLKLKAWKVKRSDTASAQDTTQHSFANAVSGSNGYSLPGTDRSLRFGNAQLSSRSVSGQMQGITGEHRSLEDLYIQLRSSNPERSGEEYFILHDFVDGTTSILHFAVKEPDSEGNTKLIERLLLHMHDHEIDVDTRDREGRTALELAVRKDSSSLTRLLLDHCADVNQTDSQGYTLLHIALKTAASPATLHLLLRRGADPNTCLPTTEKFRTAIEWLASCSGQLRPAEHIGYLTYFETVGALLEHEVGWSANELEHILRIFVDYWIVSAGSPQLFERAKPVLRTYLEAGLDPGSITCPSWAKSRRGCIHGPVVDFAALHSPNPTLALFIVRHTKSAKHLRSFVEDLLDPFCLDTARLPDADIREVLRSAVERLDSIDTDALSPPSADILQVALEISHYDHIASFLQTITSVKPNLSRFDSYSRRSKLVYHLSRHSTPVRFTIAESILVRRDGVEDPGSLPEMMRDVRRLAFQANPMGSIEGRVHTFFRKHYDPEHLTHSFFLCVLHVVTKYILSDESLKGVHAREMLIELVRIRQLNGLPDVAISQKILYNAFGNGSSGGGIEESNGCNVM